MEISRIRVYAERGTVGRERSRAFALRLTSDAGIEGWGNGFVGPGLSKVVAAIAPRIFGVDPRATTRLDLILRDVGGEASAVALAVETACWDLASKAAGMPLSLFWGGDAPDEGAPEPSRAEALAADSTLSPLARLAGQLMASNAGTAPIALHLSEFGSFSRLRLACDLCAAWHRGVVLVQDVPGDLIALGLDHLAASKRPGMEIAVQRENAPHTLRRLASQSLYVTEGPGLGVLLDETEMGEAILSLQAALRG